MLVSLSQNIFGDKIIMDGEETPLNFRLAWLGGTAPKTLSPGLSLLLSLSLDSQIYRTFSTTGTKPSIDFYGFFPTPNQPTAKRLHSINPLPPLLSRAFLCLSLPPKPLFTLKLEVVGNGNLNQSRATLWNDGVGTKFEL